MNHIKLSKTLLIIMILSAGITTKTFAQSKPQVQTVSVRAPAHIKIDGELKEWGDKSLNAYSVANRIYYVVSNDDANLYLTVRGSGTLAAHKILQDGLAFTISHSLEKAKRDKDPQNVSITYPTPHDGLTINNMLMPVLRVAEFVKDTLVYKTQIDSLTAIANTRAENMNKEIKVAGIKEITEPTLSVYNELGIKAVLHYYKGDAVIELAIPLKYLDLTVAAVSHFSYQIKLGMAPNKGTFEIPQKSGVDNSVGGLSPDTAYQFSDTDLWGEYILVAKKP